MTKPKLSTVASVLAFIGECPLTQEKQRIHEVYGRKNGLVLITRGRDSAWKHTITTEELDPAKLNMAKPKAAAKPKARAKA
jgi:hypothetical protein